MYKRLLRTHYRYMVAWKAQKNLVIMGKKNVFGKILFLAAVTNNIVKSIEHCSPTHSKTVVVRHFVEKNRKKT